MFLFQTLSYLCTMLYRDFFSYTSQRLQELGLNNGALFFLLYVGKNPHCTQAELTNALKLDWGYCQRSILKLVEDGFLVRAKEGRAYHLDLSKQGRQAFDVGHQVFFDWDAGKLGGLSAQEREQLFALLQKVNVKEANFKSCTKP